MRLCRPENINQARIDRQPAAADSASAQYTFSTTPGWIAPWFMLAAQNAEPSHTNGGSNTLPVPNQTNSANAKAPTEHSQAAK